MKIVVTGCAGFIGSNLINFLLQNQVDVVGIDNLSTGKEEFIKDYLSNPNFKFVEFDLFEQQNLDKIISQSEIIYHLSANADVRFGSNNTLKDLQQNTIVTHNILEAMRNANVKKIVFSSTGSIYGETKKIPTPEEAPFPIQTSLYGASKLAGESLIQAYCEAFDFKSWIFRFVSILGPRYTHGHVYDFIKSLCVNPNELNVLGNGLQRKSYLHVKDCISGIFFGMKNFNEKVNIINLGYDGYCQVKDSINWITEVLNINPKINYGKQDRGWIGDIPLIYLDTSKIRKTGWYPKYNIEQSVKETANYLINNKWLFENE